jgi:glycerol uptake facilitator-like aquaporin
MPAGHKMKCTPSGAWSNSMLRRLVAEGVGTGLLVATVIGSGVMAEQLAGGNAAIALLANTIATVAALAVLISLLASISGAHFNPAVSFVMALLGRMSWRDAGAYAITQIVGGLAGVLLAHAMFALPLLSIATHVRTGGPQYVSELVATFGLVLVILGVRRERDAPWMVAAWIGAAYWFTASTSFANPAVTIARCLSDTFAGIRPADVAPFIIAQILGGLLAAWVARALFQQRAKPRAPAVASVAAAVGQRN